MPETESPWVLVVDDDPGIREFIRVALQGEGYRVVTAPNGLRALEAMAERPPAVVLVDLMMPVMDGWQFHARVRETNPEVPVVFMTAGARARAEAEAHRAAGHLSKPFDLDDLIDTVARFTEQSA